MIGTILQEKPSQFSLFLRVLKLRHHNEGAERYNHKIQQKETKLVNLVNVK